MRNIALLVMTAALGTASAANVNGSQNTPLTLKVDNVCITAYTDPGWNGAAGTSRTWSQIDLGKITAITNNSVSDKLVMAVDCNYKTALNIKTPTSVKLTRDNTDGKGVDVFNITTAAWSAANPLSMSFSTAGSYQPDYGLGKYEYYEVKASFKMGGAGSGYNGAWTMPGGTYTGEIVVEFDYNE